MDHGNKRSVDIDIMYDHLIIYVLAYYARMYMNIFTLINFILGPFGAHLCDNLYASQKLHDKMGKF